MAIYWSLDNRPLQTARRRAVSIEFLRALQARLREAYPASEGHTHSVGGQRAAGQVGEQPQRELDLVVRRGDGWGVRVYATVQGKPGSPHEQLDLAGLEATAATGKISGLLIGAVAVAAFAFAIWGMASTGRISLGAGYRLFMIAGAGGMLGGTVLMVPVHALMNLRMRNDVQALGGHLEAVFAESEAKQAGAKLRRRMHPFFKHGLTTIVLSALCAGLYLWFLRAPEGMAYICGLTLGMIVCGIYAVITAGATIAAFAGLSEGPGLFAEDPPADGPQDPAAWL